MLPVLRRHEHAAPARLGVLGHVRQSLLDDPVERGLDLGSGAAGSSEPGLEVDRDPGLVRERRREPLQRADEPEVVEHLRAELERDPADVLHRRRDLAAERGDRLTGRLVVGQPLLDRLQPEHHRGERLAGLVVELAGEPAALDLLRGDDAPHGVAGDPLGEVDGDGGA